MNCLIARVSRDVLFLGEQGIEVQLPEPGWYFDPEGKERWWDGSKWTNHARHVASPNTQGFPTHQEGRQQNVPVKSQTNTKVGSSIVGFGVFFAALCIFLAMDPIIGWVAWLPGLVINTIAISRLRRNAQNIWLSVVMLAISIFYTAMYLIKLGMMVGPY